ncbi:hypothetical protein [Nocardia farcinica]
MSKMIGRNEPMSTVTTAPDTALLCTALRVDGWGTGVFGAVLLAGAAALRDPLGVPTGLSLGFGVVMLAGALALVLLGGRARQAVRHARTVVLVNSASAVGMVVLACARVLDLTGLGVAFLLSGAAIVATFAAAEYAGLRRAR